MLSLVVEHWLGLALSLGYVYDCTAKWSLEERHARKNFIILSGHITMTFDFNLMFIKLNWSNKLTLV